MSIKVNDLIHWLNSLPIDSEVGIDEGGLTLQSVLDDKVYLEVGGIPEELIITLKETTTEEIRRWTLPELLGYINDPDCRSEEWTDYNKEDWMEGWLEWCEGDCWTIVSINNSATLLKFNALRKESNNNSLT